LPFVLRWLVRNCILGFVFPNFLFALLRSSWWFFTYEMASRPLLFGAAGLILTYLTPCLIRTCSNHLLFGHQWQTVFHECGGCSWTSLTRQC
jgi:hypothetical protein